MKRILFAMSIALILSLTLSTHASSNPIGGNSLPSWEASATARQVWEGTTLPTAAYDQTHDWWSYHFELNNLFIKENYKTVWFYMEYTMPAGSGFATEKGYSYTTAPAGTTGTSKFVSGGSTDLGNGINAYTYVFEINPQPDKEWINIITGYNNTPQISISYANMLSKCEPVPEPATMLLMGTGIAGLIGLRRKKNT